MENLTPTKANLMKAKDSLAFSRKGYELLDKKRNVLIREMMSYVSKAQELQDKIDKIFKEAYESLRQANITEGINTIEDIALAIPEADDYEILYKSVMGVEVPHVKFERNDIEPSYGFYRSNSALDLAYKKFREVRYLIYELADIENAVFKLATEVKKTQKRANALNNIQIPKFRNALKVISELLEEKDREDFFRLKIVKKKKEK